MSIDGQPENDLLEKGLQYGVDQVIRDGNKVVYTYLDLVADLPEYPCQITAVLNRMVTLTGDMHIPMRKVRGRNIWL